MHIFPKQNTCHHMCTPILAALFSNPDLCIFISVTTIQSEAHTSSLPVLSTLRDLCWLLFVFSLSAELNLAGPSILWSIKNELIVLVNWKDKLSISEHHLILSCYFFPLSFICFLINVKEGAHSGNRLYTDFFFFWSFFS